MITVSVMELFLKSAKLLVDGFEKVELDESPADDEFPASLSFYALNPEFDETIDYESIEDCLDKESLTLKISADSIAPYVVTCGDLTLIYSAFSNAIENCKTMLDDTTLTADMRSDVKSGLKRFESYICKLESFLSQTLGGHKQASVQIPPVSHK